MVAGAFVFATLVVSMAIRLYFSLAGTVTAAEDVDDGALQAVVGGNAADDRQLLSSGSGMELWGMAGGGLAGALL